MVNIIFGVFVAIFALIFLGVGILALVGGKVQQRRCSASADGIVCAIHAQERKGRGKQKATVYIPEFRYETGGQTYTMKANFGSVSTSYKEGQAVTIRFDPADPGYAYVADDPGNSSQGGVLCVCLGLLLTLGALALFA